MKQRIAALREAYAAQLRADGFRHPRTKRDYVWASGIRTCVRQMALDLTNPENIRDPDDDGLSRMARGKILEEHHLTVLRRAGLRSDPPFEVIETQIPLEVVDRGQKILTGKIDAKIRWADGAVCVAEVKSGKIAEGAEDLQDIQASEWSAHWPDQLLTYCYANNQPFGILWLDHPGLPLPILISLEENLDRVTGLLEAVHSATAYARAANSGQPAILPPMTERRELCGRCDHRGKSCTPPAWPIAPAILTDPLLIQAAHDEEANREAARAYNRAHELLKDNLRGIESGTLGGEYSISGKWQQRTVYDIPEKVKPAFKRVIPEGAWKFKLTRI